MLLADHAVAAEGKLYVNGGGWTITGPDPVPSAIAMLINVPWDQTNRKHVLRLELVDADGNAIMASDPADPEGEQQPIQLTGDFEVGRPPGMTPGTPVTMPIALNLGPIPLPPGRRYSWNLFLNDQTREDWALPFATRPS